MAVAVGMVMMTKASEKHGLTEAGTAYKIEEVCATYGLPTTDDASLENCRGGSNRQENFGLVNQCCFA